MIKRLLLNTFSLALLSSALYAQTSQNTFKISAGQQFKEKTTSKVASTMTVGGQEMVNDSESTIENTIRVERLTPNALTFKSITGSMALHVQVMGQEMWFDSKNPADVQGELGKSIMPVLGKPVMITTDGSGKITGVLYDASINEELQEMINAQAEMAPGTPFKLLLPVAKKTVGQSWTDSLKRDSLQYQTTYTLKQLKGNEATVAFVTRPGQ